MSEAFSTRDKQRVREKENKNEDIMKTWMQ